METKKIIMLAVIGVMATHSLSGKNDSLNINRASVLRVQLSLGAGYMPAYKAINVMVHCDGEYFLQPRFSVRSDFYYSLSTRTRDEMPPFRFNHTLFTGASYHFFTQSPVDAYIGFQPGIALGKRRFHELEHDNITQLPGIQSAISPVMSINTGLTYYGNRFFTAFVHLRYIYGYHYDNYADGDLQEIRVSFGLGYYMHTNKIRKKTRAV